jgi:hypothetical protein
MFTREYVGEEGRITEEKVHLKRSMRNIKAGGTGET